MIDLAKANSQTHHGDCHSVTVLAPTPQDAKYCNQILREHGLSVEIVPSIYDADKKLRAGAGVLLLSQEFLTPDSMNLLREAIGSQPSWSDTPVLVLLDKLETSAPVVADLLSLGNVTLIERPLKIALLVSTLKAKLRDRARQYEVRDLLHKAQQASKSKSAFVANISHEIRTPMTSILGYAELMSNLIDDEEALRYLSTIRRNGDFLLGIINDILDLSKIEAEKLDIEIERFDPALVIDDVRSVMDIRASEKGIRLEVEYATQLPEWIESDSKRLRQILINLVGNAIKFTTVGSVKIVVSFQLQAVMDGSYPHSDGRLKFEVIDSGIGMTSEQLERLFVPFSQGDSMITQQFGGTGLGLAISQRLATMLNGDIRVESEFEKGSRFILTVATGDISAASLRWPREASAPKNARPSAIDLHLSARVLIVDDRRDIRFLSNRIITMAGGEVTEAEDGLQALEAVKNAWAQDTTFDVILLDMQMPNMDGYQAAAELRQMGFANPIIALTADTMQGAVAKCVNAGCDYHISKPINRIELLSLLHELTTKRSLSAERQAVQRFSRQ